jgi:hypothetical protein
VDLMPFVEDSISSFGLSGEAITFLWKWVWEMGSVRVFYYVHFFYMNIILEK